MHVFLTTFGSSGDVFPILGLAEALHQRGHRVTVATNEHFANKIPHADIRFLPIGTEADFHRCASHPDLWHPRRSFAYLFECLKPWIQIQYDLIRNEVENAKKGEHLVCISNCLSFGALAANEKFNIPNYTLHVQPAVLWSDINPPHLPNVVGPNWLKRLLFRIGEKLVIDRSVLPFLNPWRAGLGLPPISGTVRSWNSETGVLCLFPHWYAEPQPDWPQPIHLTDFPLWNHASSQPMDDEVRSFLDAGSRPIVFTPGSANVHGKKFFEAAIQACKLLGRRGILLTEFRDQVPSELPDQLRWFRYVPLDHLLPRSAAFVHHGGIGSSSQGLLAGVPQLIMPLAHDQFDNAHRLQTLRVADALSPKKFTGERVAAKLKRLLESDATKSACQVARSLTTEGRGLSDMAAFIERDSER